jgi:hypothetical protein
MGIPFDVDALNQLRSELLLRRDRLDREMAGREREQGELERIDTQAEMVDLAQNLELIERKLPVGLGARAFADPGRRLTP